jgi:hypothetical protein
MTDLHGLLEKYVANGALPGAVGLVAGPDRTGPRWQPSDRPAWAVRR